MKYLIKYRLFESKYEHYKSIIDTLKDLSIEFEDNNCGCRIEPSNDIKIKVMSLQSRDYISIPFYIEIDIDRRIITPDESRSGFGTLPDWFIDNCRRIEYFMSSQGFNTLPSVRYGGTDWENFDTIDELAEQESLIYKVRLEFYTHEFVGYAVGSSSQMNESISNLKQILSDIFLEVSDQTTWIVWVEGDDISNLYEIYISFGDEYPYNRDTEEIGYQQKEIPEELIDCIKRAIDFMDSRDFYYNILFCSEYSSDRGEDHVSNIDIDDLYEGMTMSENEAIRINFRK